MALRPAQPGPRSGAGPEAGRGRPVLAVVVGAAASGLSALILGEYSMAGFTPVVAGVLLGVAMGELLLTLARTPDWPTAAAAAVLTDAALGVGTWIGYHDRHQVPFGLWIALVLGTVASAGWIRSSARRATSSRAGSSQTGGG